MIRALFDDYLTKLKAAIPTLTTLLGHPEVGEPDAIFPCAAIEIESLSEAEAPRPIRRLGQLEGTGIGIEVRLYLYAASEAELLDLLSSFQALRRTLSEIGDGFIVRYGITQRIDADDPNPYLRHCTITPLTFTQHGGL